MKHSRVLLALLVLFANLAWADPVGTWKILMDGPGGTHTNFLTIRQEAGAHIASMATPQGEVDIGEIQVTGDHIEFTLSRPMGPRTMTMHYKADVNGDVMTGNVESARGTLPFTGTRE